MNNIRYHHYKHNNDTSNRAASIIENCSYHICYIYSKIKIRNQALISCCVLFEHRNVVIIHSPVFYLLKIRIGKIAELCLISCECSSYFRLFSIHSIDFCHSISNHHRNFNSLSNQLLRIYSNVS